MRVVDFRNWYISGRFGRDEQRFGFPRYFMRRFRHTIVAHFETAASKAIPEIVRSAFFVARNGVAGSRAGADALAFVGRE